MASIPAAWQSALGEPYLTGNGALSIISRTSSGPALFGFNPSTFSTSTSTTPTPYAYYPIDDPLGEQNTHNALFDGNTNLNGIVFVPGSRTVLVFGSVGTNSVLYGTNSQANDPYRGSKGYHSINGDYAYQVWAYDANSFLAVMDGQMQPWQVQPYATWNFDFPQYQGAKTLGGITFDPSTDRIYVMEQGADTQASGSYLPVIQVYQLVLSTSGLSVNDSIPLTDDSLGQAADSTLLTASNIALVSAATNDSPTAMGSLDDIRDAPMLTTSSINGKKQGSAPQSIFSRSNTLLRLANPSRDRIPRPDSRWEGPGRRFSRSAWTGRRLLTRSR